MSSPWTADRLAERLAAAGRGIGANVARPAALAAAGPPAPATAREAAVTLVARPTPGDLEILLVRRAEVVGDPWSGHMALPGGHREPSDPDILATARRETREEVGLELPPAAFVGRLPALSPSSARLPLIHITPFVAWHGAGGRVRSNREVAYHVWAPLSALADPARHVDFRYRGGGRERVFPSILYGGDTIWGLTHRVVMEFIDIHQKTEAALP